MADKVTVVPLRDPWPSSTVVVGDLEALVADGLLRPLSGGPQPEWMAPSKADPTPPPGYVVSFIPFHERGFGVPAGPALRIWWPGARQKLRPHSSQIPKKYEYYDALNLSLCFFPFSLLDACGMW
jgi:hypothetical protein